MKPMSEIQPVPAQTEPTNTDPNEMPLDDLRELINSGELPPSEAAPEAEVAEVTDEATPEVAQEEESTDDEVSAAPESEEAVEDEPEEDEPSEIQLRLDESEAKAKHFESVAGRHSSKVGYLERQLGDLRTQVQGIMQQRQRAAATDDLDLAPEPAPMVQPAPPQRDEALHKWAMNQAMTTTGQNFRTRHADAIDETGADFDPGFKAVLANYEDQLTAAVQCGDPIRAAQEMSEVMEDAYGRYDISRAAGRRKDARRRSADQAKGLKDKKRAAAVSTSSGKTASPKTEAPDPMTMPIEDLKELIEEINRQT